MVPSPCAWRVTTGPAPASAMATSTTPDVGPENRGTATPSGGRRSPSPPVRANASIGPGRLSRTSFSKVPGSQLAAGDPVGQTSAADAPQASTRLPPPRTQASIPQRTSAGSLTAALPVMTIASAASNPRAAEPTAYGAASATTTVLVPRSRSTSQIQNTSRATWGMMNSP